MIGFAGCRYSISCCGFRGKHGALFQFGKSISHQASGDSRTDRTHWCVDVDVAIIVPLTMMTFAAINMAGVTWVIKLQLVLLGFIFLAVADLLLGSLVASDIGRCLFSVQK